MAKPNYAFAKRQRELAKKQKKDEKLKRKAEQGGAPEAPEHDESTAGDAAESPPPEGSSPT